MVRGSEEKNETCLKGEASLLMMAGCSLAPQRDYCDVKPVSRRSGAIAVEKEEI